MKPLNAYLPSKLTKFGAAVITAGTALVAPIAHADMVADLQTKITEAAGQATTVGGYVAVAVAGLVVVGLVIGVIKKL